MTVEQMRYFLINSTPYKSDTWTKKVNKMPDKQVIALYYKMIRETQHK